MCGKGIQVFVQLETDLKVLVEMLNGVLVPEAAMEGILWKILHIRQQLCSVEFLFTHRAYNEATHHVASFAKRMGGIINLWNCFEPE